MESAPFRFDADSHVYTDARGRVPNITGLLTLAGWVDEQWLTGESSWRGRVVHKLTADYDMRAVDVADVEGEFRPYLLAHVDCLALVKPEWLHIEVGAVHPTLRFAGTPDRVASVFRARSVWEVKSGERQKSHAIQTALQAILASPELRLPPTAIHRYAEYLTPDGRYKLDQHKDRRDFAEARRIIAKYC